MQRDLGHHLADVTGVVGLLDLEGVAEVARAQRGESLREGDDRPGRVRDVAHEHEAPGQVVVQHRLECVVVAHAAVEVACTSPA